jgi:hypothetical protein
MKPAPTRPAARPIREAPDPNFRFALTAILLVTFLRVMWLAGDPIDLHPDEAQYWIWAQHPDWGYYSKPPMVAWIIAATTTLFGEGTLPVKAGAPILYILTSLLVFLLAGRLYDRRIAAWSAIAFVTLPAVSISSVIISTDVPLLFCWTLATYALVRAREPQGDRWWPVVAVAVGLGLLSKFAMGFWLGSALGFLAVFADERRHLRRFLLSLPLAALIYAPNLVWNWRHGFVSYLHTRDNADVHGLAVHPLAFAEFALSQFGVFGPVFLGSLLAILASGRRVWEDRRAALLMFLALPTLAIMLSVSALSRAQPNWSAPTYVTATILVVAWLSARGREALVQWSVVLHVAAAVALFGLGDVERKFGSVLPGHFDPLHRLHGYRVLGESLSAIRAREGMPPLLADERELMASMIYYMAPHPFDMAMWNPGGGVRNGFELAQSLPDKPGGDFLWLTGRKERDDVYARFQSHEQVAHVMVPIGGGLFREVWAYSLRGFKGYAGPS